MPDRNRVLRSYDRVAGKYTEHALIEREMAVRLEERLNFMNLAPKRILDGGCGEGVALASLGRRYPQAELIGVDFSELMLKEAARRNPGACLVAADIVRLPMEDGHVGIYWSNACLHLSPDYRQVFSEASRVVEEDGLFIFSTFGPDTLREMRQVFSGLDSNVHTGHFVDMHHLGDTLRGCGLADPVMETEEIVVLYSDPADLVAELRKSGAANVAKGAKKSLTGRTMWRRFLTDYREQFGNCNGKVKATFELILGHAWRKSGQPREAPGLNPIRLY